MAVFVEVHVEGIAKAVVVIIAQCNANRIVLDVVCLVVMMNVAVALTYATLV